MKKKFIIALILIMSMVFGAALSSCAKKPENLESFIQSNDDVKEQLQNAADSAGLNVEIKENTVTYSFDLSTIEGADEETLKDPAMIEKLQESLDSQNSTFVDLCRNLEEQSGFTGIQMIVNYTYGDEVLVTKTFTSAD